jgi:hypothetical protein
LTKPSAPTTRSSDWISPTPPSTAPSTRHREGARERAGTRLTGETGLEVVDPDGPSGHSDRLGDQRCQPPRQRPFHPDTALGGGTRPARRHRDAPPRPWLRQRRGQGHVSCIRAQRRDLRTPTTGQQTGAKATTSPRTYRATMASRADQLVALELWPAATEHRPLALASARADGTRSHAAADRQTHRLAKPVGRLKDAYSLVLIVPFAISTANRS